MTTAVTTRFVHILDIEPDFGVMAPDWQAVGDIESEILEVDISMSKRQVDEFVWDYVLDQLDGIDVNEINWEFAPVGA